MAMTLTGSPQITAVALDAAINAELAANWFPLVGVINGSNAAAGTIGEYLNSAVASGAAVALTTGVAANVTTISLTPGDWDVQGMVKTAPAAGTLTTLVFANCSSTSATLGNDATESWANNAVAAAAVGLATARIRFNVTVATTIYLVASVSFTTSTLGAYGRIDARRVR